MIFNVYKCAKVSDIFIKITLIRASLALNLRIREEDILKCSGVNIIEFL